MLEGLPAERSYCAELAVEALHGAVISAWKHIPAVRKELNPLEEHGPRGSAADPAYRLLMETPAPPGIAAEDRHLFACLFSAAARDPHEPAAALGLGLEEVSAILSEHFPGIGRADLERHATPVSGPPPDSNPEVLDILLFHVPLDESGGRVRNAQRLARIIAARAAHPGHLWVAMGFFERPELTAAIRRHLPTLAAANNQNMRWKRYLFKQVCDLHGARLCKAPNCGVCSDYELCFPPD